MKRFWIKASFAGRDYYFHSIKEAALYLLIKPITLAERLSVRDEAYSNGVIISKVETMYKKDLPKGANYVDRGQLFEK